MSSQIAKSVLKLLEHPVSNKNERVKMKQMKWGKGFLFVLILFTLLVFPVKANADEDFLVTVGRMATVVPFAIVRAAAFVVEGAIDGVVEGLTGRTGLLHGDSRYI